MLNLTSLVQRAGAAASALAGRGVPEAAVDEALRLLLGLPADGPAPAPPAPPPTASMAPPDRKKPSPKTKGNTTVKAAAVKPPPDVEHLDAIARDIYDGERQHREGLREVLADARALYRSATGKHLTNLHRGFREGDSRLIHGLDHIARTLADRYPEWLGPHGYEHGDGNSQAAAQTLFDLLAKGLPPECRWADARKRAAGLTFPPAADDPE